MVPGGEVVEAGEVAGDVVAHCCGGEGVEVFMVVAAVGEASLCFVVVVSPSWCSYNKP